MTFLSASRKLFIVLVFCENVYGRPPHPIWKFTVHFSASILLLRRLILRLGDQRFPVTAAYLLIVALEIILIERSAVLRNSS